MLTIHEGKQVVYLVGIVVDCITNCLKYGNRGRWVGMRFCTHLWLWYALINLLDGLDLPRSCACRVENLAAGEAGVRQDRSLTQEYVDTWVAS